MTDDLFPCQFGTAATPAGTVAWFGALSVVCGILLLSPRSAETCVPTDCPPNCGVGLMMAKGSTSTVVPPKRVDIPVSLMMNFCTRSTPCNNLASMQSVDVTLTGNCPNRPNGTTVPNPTSYSIPINTWSTRNVAVRFPMDPQGDADVCTISGTVSSTLSLPGGNNVTVTQTGDTSVCLVPEAPLAPGRPKVEVALVGADGTSQSPQNSVNRAVGGDVMTSYYRVTNFYSQSVQGTFRVTSENPVGMPQSMTPASFDAEAEGFGVYSVSDPNGKGENYPLAFADTANKQCISLPGPKSFLEDPPRDVSRSLQLGPFETELIPILTRSRGRCGTGACNEQKAFWEVTPPGGGGKVTACAGTSSLIDNTLTPDYQCSGCGGRLEFPKTTGQGLEFSTTPKSGQNALTGSYSYKSAALVGGPGRAVTSAIVDQMENHGGRVGVKVKDQMTDFSGGSKKIKTSVGFDSSQNVTFQTGNTKKVSGHPAGHTKKSPIRLFDVKVNSNQSNVPSAELRGIFQVSVQGKDANGDFIEGTIQNLQITPQSGGEFSMVADVSLPSSSTSVHELYLYVDVVHGYSSASRSGPSLTENCSNGRDDDRDGAIDCADQDCSCSSSESNCNDLTDNDYDGSIDCTDSDCNCTESKCGDGLDNDLDGSTDCADPDCAGTSACAMGGEGDVGAPDLGDTGPGPDGTADTTGPDDTGTDTGEGDVSEADTSGRDTSGRGGGDTSVSDAEPRDVTGGDGTGGGGSGSSGDGCGCSSASTGEVPFAPLLVLVLLPLLRRSRRS